MVKEEKKRKEKSTIDRQSLRLHVLSEDADDALSARQLQSFSKAAPFEMGSRSELWMRL